MCDPVLGSAAAATLLGSTALQVYQGEQARKRQNQAADKARIDADQAFNKANPKKPNAAAMLEANKADAAAGPGSTLLTGTLGVDPSLLLLGRQTLLGGSGG